MQDMVAAASAATTALVTLESAADSVEGIAGEEPRPHAILTPLSATRSRAVAFGMLL